MTAAKLAEIRAHWQEARTLAPEETEWLLAELERYQNMLADCRKHRDRAEQNERKLLARAVQIHELLHDEYGE